VSTNLLPGEENFEENRKFILSLWFWVTIVFSFIFTEYNSRFNRNSLVNPAALKALTSFAFITSDFMRNKKSRRRKVFKIKNCNLEILSVMLVVSPSKSLDKLLVAIVTSQTLIQDFSPSQSKTFLILLP
jgi:hypothetical protein